MKFFRKRKEKKKSRVLLLLFKSLSASTRVWNFLITGNCVEFICFACSLIRGPPRQAGSLKHVEFLFVFLCFNFRDLRRQSASSHISETWFLFLLLLFLFISGDFTAQNDKHKRNLETGRLFLFFSYLFILKFGQLLGLTAADPVTGALCFPSPLSRSRGVY